MNFILLSGRILYALIFILASFGHFSAETIAYAANAKVPLASILVPISGVISLLGGLSILLGYKARLGAGLIILFLIPVTFLMHPFWTILDPKAAHLDQIMFMKNLSLLGAALMITYFGSGPLSLNNKS